MPSVGPGARSLQHQARMNEKQTPRNVQGEPPTDEPQETATRLEQKADEQVGDANRARTEDKARHARDGAGRSVRFGG